MAVTPKTAGAVATVLGGGAAAGVGIHQLSKETPINNELLGKLETVKTKFGLDLENADCKNLLRKDKYSKDDYRAAILGCSQSKTFSEIAKNLNLDVLSDEDKGNDKGGTWGTNNKENIQKLVETTKNKTAGEGTDKVQTLLVNHCTNSSNNKIFSTTTKTEEGHNFLTICTKEKTGTNYTTRSGNLSKDFGTDKSTIKSKIKEAGFALKATLDAECKTKLEEDFDEYKGNYKTAVMACVASSDFDSRAKELGLHALPSEESETTGSSDGNTIKARVKGAIPGGNGETTDDGTNSKTKVKEHCTTANKKIEDSFEQKDGINYLNACTKNKTTSETKHNEALGKDFGTGKSTSTQA